MWLPIDYKKYDGRKARDGEKDTDLSPKHRRIVRDIGGQLLGANRRTTDWRDGWLGDKQRRDRMDYRIEAFLIDVLLLEGENPKVVREGVRRRIVECEKQFRDAEPDKRIKDKAAQSVALFAVRAFSKRYIAVEERGQPST